MAGYEIPSPSPSWMACEEGWTSLDCPECFPAVEVVKAAGAESTSCGAGSGGRGCEWELEPAIWPGMRWRVQEAEYLCLPEVAVVESGWLNQAAQGERVEEVVQVRRWKEEEKQREPVLQHWERPGVVVQVVGAGVLPQSLFLAVEPQL